MVVLANQHSPEVGPVMAFDKNRCLLKRKTLRMKTTFRRTSGFTLVEIMIVVAIVGLLATIAIPSWVRARTTSQQNACINNLRQIDGAKQQWGLDTRAIATATPGLSNIQPYMGRGSAGSSTSCPSDSAQTFATSYTIGDLSSSPTCQIVSSAHVLQ
jgi:prepilin-type N-terminal cleavage/methylation domain-containing protein